MLIGIFLGILLAQSGMVSFERNVEKGTYSIVLGSEQGMDKVHEVAAFVKMTAQKEMGATEGGYSPDELNLFKKLDQLESSYTRNRIERDKYFIKALSKKDREPIALTEVLYQ